MTIRNYKPKDKERLRYICKETAWDSYKADENRLESVPIMFNDYFTEQEPEFAFVLADDNDLPAGYIICSANYDNFVNSMKTVYTERLYAVAPDEVSFLNNFLSSLEKIKDHPVHFHIDILPDFQRQGWGRKLMQKLWNKLKSENIDYLSGCCISRNSDGYKAYMKLGFEEIYDYGNNIVSIIKYLR